MCEIKQWLLNMLIICISWCFPVLWMCCECYFLYTEGCCEDLNCDSWRPSGQPEHIDESCPSSMVGPPWDGSCPCHSTRTYLDLWGKRDSAPEGCVCPNSGSHSDYCKGFCQGLCAVKTQFLSGWEQPVFHLLPAFLLLGMQLTSLHDLGTELSTCQ